MTSINAVTNGSPIPPWRVCCNSQNHFKFFARKNKSQTVHISLIYDVWQTENASIEPERNFSQKPSRAKHRGSNRLPSRYLTANVFSYVLRIRMKNEDHYLS